MTLSPTLSLKNTIPTLVLLVAIFMMSGCGLGTTLNNLADDAKGAFDDILDGLDPNDPCRHGNAVFTNPSCLGEVPNEQTYNQLREARCTISNDIEALCALTIERVCTANLDHNLCSAQVYVDLRTERDAALKIARLNVVIADWTDGTDDDGVVGGLNADPSRTHTNNQFLTGLVLNTTWRTFDELQGNDVLSDDAKADVFVVNNFSDSGDLTLAFEQSEDSNSTGTRPAFAVFKAVGANEDDTTTTGDARDGVVFASGLYVQQSGCEGDLCLINRHYAGLLSTTDLGAPLTESLAQGTWQGWIQTRGDVSYNQRFDLTITFDEGTNGGTIDAYVTNAENNLIALKIDGVFNDQGFVTGDILHGTASNNQIGSGRSPGQLRGLIGDEGAVVAFLSDATGRKGGTNDDPRDQYSGGFVAYLVNPIPATDTKTQAPPADPCIAANTCVDYAHWVAAASPTATPTTDRFLQGTSGGLMGAGQGELGVYTTLASNASRYNLEDGVQGAAYAIYRPDRNTEVHNAGILSTTRLGAPLSGTITNAKWLGTFQERAGTKLTSNNITLIVGFGAGEGTITGSSQTFASYEFVDVIFGSTGVISGAITRRQGEDTSNGVISGLIGVDGLVSVFHSNTGATTSFVGGFLASPPAPAPTVTAVDTCIAANTCVDYTHWADADAANPADAPTANRFLKGRPNGLLGSTTTSRLTTKNNTGSYGLAGGDRKDGFATSTNDAGIHSVGLFSTTNLGAPLSKQTPRALWAGTLQHRAGTNPIGSFGITLTVTFDAGTKAGTITSGNVGTTYAIDATFNHVGVIDGDITRRHAGDTSAGTVSGLIGQEGAVGVFHSNAGATTPYIGGFLGSPPAPQG